VKRFVLTLLFFAASSLGVGVVMAGDDNYFDWAVAGGLFGLAVAGELFRLWVKKSRVKIARGGRQRRNSRREASGI
jgi:pilus assembly protein TadC